MLPPSCAALALEVDGGDGVKEGDDDVAGAFLLPPPRRPLPVGFLDVVRCSTSDVVLKARVEEEMEESRPPEHCGSTVRETRLAQRSI